MGRMTEPTRSTREWTDTQVLEPKEGDVIAVWFSCGAASAVAAKLTVERYGNTCDVRIVNHPVAEEDPDNRRFLSDISRWLGKPIEDSRSARFPEASCDSVWKQERGFVFPHGAPCTRYLKIAAGQEWKNLHQPHWHVFGFTSEERRRHERFVLTEWSNVIPVLIDAGLAKHDCAQIIREAGIELPAAYLRGYPNANCIGCVKATSPTYWNHVRKVDPEVFAERARQSREYGAKPFGLVRYKGRRIHLDDLPPDAVGRPMKTLQKVECGLFCEEPEPRLLA